MKKSALILSSILMISSSVMASTDIAGVTIPDSITPQGEDLNFNGAGVRSKFFIDLYVGSLFTTQNMHKGEAVINSASPVAIRLNITSDMITSEKMADAMRDGFKLATAGNSAKIDDKIKDFIATFSAPIEAGDQFTLLSVPGEGLISYKNGQFLSIIPGEDFRKTVLAIWLGKKSIDKSLKQDMLGR